MLFGFAGMILNSAHDPIYQRCIPRTYRSAIGRIALKPMLGGSGFNVPGCPPHTGSYQRDSVFSFACTSLAISLRSGFSTACMEAMGSTAATSTCPSSTSCTTTLHDNWTSALQLVHHLADIAQASPGLGVFHGTLTVAKFLVRLDFFHLKYETTVSTISITSAGSRT